MTSLTKLAVAISVLVLACAANASLITDPHGMNGGSLGQWQNTIRLQSSPAVIAVDVDYCVYAPGQFGLSFPSWIDPNDPAYSSHYVYAYQIFNTLDPHPFPSLKGTVRRFSIGLNDGDEEAANIGFLLDDPNHKSSSNPEIGLDTAGWEFSGSDEVTYGYVSAILFFTSPYSPETDKGTASGTQGFYGRSEDFPSPTPEPATVGLLGVGWVVLVTRKVRRAKG